MTTTTTPTGYLYRPCLNPTSAIAIWWLVPIPLRQLLRAGVPLDSRQHGCGTESLVVAVGSGCPLRWLQVNANDAGELEARLWEVRRTGTKGLAGEVVKPADLPALLTRWAGLYGLNR